MPIDDARDPAPDGWSRPQEKEAPRKAKDPRTGWLRRLLGAVLPAREEAEPRAVREAAETLEQDGAVVFANLDGWPRPPALHGFIPDVYAVFEDREVVLEFEDEESVQKEPAQRQDAAFATWADAAPGRDYEQIVVEGRRRARDLR
jgi:hypothetical protein